MKKKILRLLKRLKRPSGKVLVLTYVLSVIFIAIAMCMLFVDYSGTALEILAYTSFALAAIGLSYSVYTIVIYAPGAKARTIELLQKNEFTKNVLENWGYRTVITSIIAFCATLANSALNAYLGISEKSIWFGALAAYYIFLALMRGGFLLHQKRKKSFENESVSSAKNYTHCGILLLILNAALSSAIAQMIFDDRSFEYKDWFIYAFAAYAFYKIFNSVRNVVRARSQDDLTIQAVRNIGLIDSLVSILALQTALLHTFGNGSVDISLFNTITGSAVSAASVGISIFMIVRGRKTLRNLQKR